MSNILLKIYIIIIRTIIISEIMKLSQEKENKEKMFIQIKSIWYYNVYIHKLKLSIKHSD